MDIQAEGAGRANDWSRLCARLPSKKGKWKPFSLSATAFRIACIALLPCSDNVFMMTNITFRLLTNAFCFSQRRPRRRGPPVAPRGPYDVTRRRWRRNGRARGQRRRGRPQEPQQWGGGGAGRGPPHESDAVGGARPVPGAQQDDRGRRVPAQQRGRVLQRGRRCGADILGCAARGGQARGQGEETGIGFSKYEFFNLWFIRCTWS